MTTYENIQFNLNLQLFNLILQVINLNLQAFNLILQVLNLNLQVFNLNY